MTHLLLNQKSIFTLKVYLLSFLFLCFITTMGITATPGKINYQGKLMEDGAPVGDSAPVQKTTTFKLFDAESGGLELWSSGPQNVTVSKGLFNYVLGSNVPLNIDWESGNVYLEIMVGSTMLSPREQLTNTAYAFLAENVVANIVSSIDGVVNDAGNIDLVAGANINIVSDDANNTITISASATGTGGGDITGVAAGDGLTGGGTAGDVTLNIGAGAGINVAANSISATLGTSIDSSEIVDGTIITTDLANNAVNSVKIADGSVTGADVASNTLSSSHLSTNIVSSVDGVVNDGGNIDLVAGANITITPNDAANTITISATGGGGGDITGVTAGNGLTGGGTAGDVTLNIGAGTGINVIADSISATLGTSIVSSEIVDMTIVTADLANNAVNSAKIVDGTITTADLANNAVNSAKIANGTITTADLANNAVNSAKIVDSSVTSADVLNNSLTSSDLLTNIVSSVDGVVNDGGNIDLVAGANINIMPDDAANTITISATGSGIIETRASDPPTPVTGQIWLIIP